MHRTGALGCSEREGRCGAETVDECAVTRRAQRARSHGGGDAVAGTAVTRALYRSELRQCQALATRLHVVATAAELFAELGYARTTLTKIAAAPASRSRPCRPRRQAARMIASVESAAFGRHRRPERARPRHRPALRHDHRSRRGGRLHRRRADGDPRALGRRHSGAVRRRRQRPRARRLPRRADRRRRPTVPPDPRGLRRTRLAARRHRLRRARRDLRHHLRHGDVHPHRRARRVDHRRLPRLVPPHGPRDPALRAPPAEVVG